MASISKDGSKFLLVSGDLGCDHAELCVQSGSDDWHDQYQSNGHSSSDQRVFDSGRAGFVFKKLLQHLKLSNFVFSTVQQPRVAELEVNLRGTS